MIDSLETVLNGGPSRCISARSITSFEITRSNMFEEKRNSVAFLFKKTGLLAANFALFTFLIQIQKSDMSVP